MVFGILKIVHEEGARPATHSGLIAGQNQAQASADGSEERSNKVSSILILIAGILHPVVFAGAPHWRMPTSMTPPDHC
jgi:hypothetical protein